ncbi:hypothetical protein [Commensalibacter papalotli (ex Botero et al. 2024)]|uniref:hypothetical protein n=1 Tax=Commensalibacter papalotli (ex Botero et al. 2024) TaxID=2972766 RepID=UPI00249244C4|nr:hypothetical protein [Commensalibacter papalotli (ex Botero et al. 2024)]
MLQIILIIVGVLIIIASFIFYSFLVEFAHGMASTGCGQYCSIRWSDFDFTKSDALIFYIPAAFGLILMILGIYIYYRRKIKHH